MKIHKNPIEESFTAKSKASGRVVNFASQQNRDDAVKSGEYEETDDVGGEPAAAKPKVNIFDKPKPQDKPASDNDGAEAKPPMAATPVVKTPVDVLKSKVEKWSEKEKAFFRDGIHKEDSPERRNWKDAIKDKAKGAIAAIKKGAKHEVEEFKAAGAGVKNFFSGKELSEHEKKALKAVAIKVATTAIFGAVTGGAGHGVLAFGKHVAMEFIPHVVGETILKGAGTAALFAGDEEEDIDMERFMAIIADKMANEKITPELMTKMVDSYNAKKGEGATNEEISQLTGDQTEMVNGIVEMLLQIKDIDNRMEVAQQQIQNFKDEGINFNYAGFLSAAGLDNNDEPIMMNTKTMPQHILNKESIMNEEFKHLIHVDTPTQVVSKPVAAQIMALAKKGVRSKDIGLEMGFVGNAKLAADTFQKVKNKIYFELGKKFEAVNVKVDGTEPESSEETLESLKKMAMGDLERIEDYAEMISDRMKEGQELSAWMYSQITLAVDQLNAVHDTMDGKDGVKESVITEDTKRVKILGIDFNISEMNGRIFFSFMDKKAASIKIREIGTNKIVNLIQKSLDNAYGKGEFFFKGGDHAEFQNGYLFQRSIGNIKLNKLKFEATLTEKKYYVTYNKGRGQGKDLEKEFDQKTFKTTNKPKVFNSYSDAKKYAEKMEKMFQHSIGGGTAYWVSDEKMNPIKESVNEEKVYIDYLNKEKGFKQDRIKFNSYEDAVKWARKNFDKFSPDMIKYESVNEAMGNDKSMLALADVLSNSMEHYDESDFLQVIRGGQGWSGIAGFKNSSLIPVFKSIYKKYWTVSPQNRTNWNLKDWINWLKPFALEENWNSEMDTVEESTPGEQIQNLNNRLTKLRQDMAKAKSPEAKNVIQARMKNALQKLSNKKKDLGIKKP
jgi:hypothetical protein